VLTTDETAPVAGALLVERILCGVRKRNPLRRFAIFVTTHRFFDRVILMLILINSIALAFDQPTGNGPVRTEVLRVLELVFNISFTIELLLRVFAMGFCLHRGAYLRDSWNRLDFVIVIAGWIPLLLALVKVEGPSVSGFRMLRALKVVRTTNKVRGMRDLVGALVNSIPAMLEVFVLLMFIFLIFGIVGVQFFKGAFRQTCYQVVRQEVNATTHPALEWPLHLQLNETFDPRMLRHHGLGRVWSLGAGTPVRPRTRMNVSTIAFNASIVNVTLSTPVYAKSGGVCRLGSNYGCPVNDTCAPENPTVLVLNNGSVYMGLLNGNPNSGYTNFDGEYYRSRV
jgi:hypothetical protein